MDYTENRKSKIGNRNARADRFPISDSRFSSLEKRNDLTRPRMPIEFGLLENGLAVPMDLKAPAARRNERHHGIAELSLDLGRQTDGPRFVASKRAVLDGDFHVGSGAVMGGIPSSVGGAEGRRGSPAAR
jgi:hypothetical protein